jgi:hypothetical protein
MGPSADTVRIWIICGRGSRIHFCRIHIAPAHVAALLELGVVSSFC